MRQQVARGSDPLQTCTAGLGNLSLYATGEMAVMGGYSFIPQLHLFCVYRSVHRGRRDCLACRKGFQCFRTFFSQRIFELNSFFTQLNYVL